MTATHTRGPWVYLDIGEVAAGEDCEITIAIMNDGGNSADVLEVEANARLIAAAPELLAALKGALGALEQDVDTGADYNDADWSGIAQQRLEAAKAAIAKAEGAA